MHVIVLPRDAAAMTDDPRVVSAELDEALMQSWSYDAHFCAYEPRTIPVRNTDRHAIVRLLHEAHDDRPAAYDVLDVLDEPCVRMVAMVGDVDAPEHVATPEWRRATEAQLEATGLAWYGTRGGYRVIAATSFAITSREDAATWTRVYLGWCAYLERTHGLVLDRACKDWTRLYRLPNVVRDGESTRAVVHGAMRAFDPAREWIDPGGADAPRVPRVTERAPSRNAIERAHTIVSRMPASIEGDGGDQALLKAASAAAAEIGEDAASILAVLVESFAPRCVPPWDAAKIAREAARAAERMATPEARYGLRAHERALVAAAAVDATSAPVGGATGEIGKRHSFRDPELPIDYLCRGLCLAPSDGKISLIAGEPGGGKGPLADYLALCFATGSKAFDTHVCTRVNVLLVDCEGARLTMRRLRRLARGMGVVPDDATLHVYDTSRTDIAALEWHAALAEYVAAHAIGVVVLDSYTSAMLSTGVEANTPQFALLAKDLGRLGVLVLCVAHTNKGLARRGGEPRLSDVAYSGAFAAMAQTAIVVSYPSESDRHLVRVACARAPEDGFAAFGARFADADNGEALTVSPAPLPAKDDGRGNNPANQARVSEKLSRALAAGERIIAHMREPNAHAKHSRKRLIEIGGEGRYPAEKAMALLREAGLVLLRDEPSGHWFELTAKGAMVALANIAAALLRQRATSAEGA